MKHIITCACLALFTAPLLADEQFVIQAKFIEATAAIPHNLATLSTTKGVDLLSSPTVTVRTGQQACIEIVREYQPPTLAPTTFETVPTGVIVRVTPHLKNGQIAFTAQLTLRELIGSQIGHTQTSAELSSRDLYVSGTPKDGEQLWFHFAEPRKGKKIAVWLQLKRKDV